MIKVSLFILLVFVLANAVTNSSVSPDEIEIFEKNCADKFKTIDSISEMREFVDLIKKVRKMYNDLPDKPNKKIQRCLGEYDAVLELGKLLEYKHDERDVCHPDHIGNILNYHHKYVLHSGRNVFTSTHGEHKRMVRHFFKRYVMTISFTCRENMAKNMNDVHGELTPDEWLEIFPWRAIVNEVGSKEGHEIISTADENLSQNTNEISTIPSKEEQERKVNQTTTLQGLSILFESIQTIDKLISVLPIGMDEKTYRPETALNNEENAIFGSLMMKVKEKEPRLTSIIEMCIKLSRFYEGGILSIVRLDNAGYYWKQSDIDKRVDASDEQKSKLEDWFKVSQMCYFLRKFVDIPEEQYHSYESNKLNENDKLLSSKFISQHSESKFRRIFTIVRRKFIYSVNNFVTNLVKGKNGVRSELTPILALNSYIDSVSGDIGSKEETTSLSLGGTCIVILILIILYGIAFGICYGITHSVMFCLYGRRIYYVAPIGGLGG